MLINRPIAEEKDLQEDIKIYIDLHLAAIPMTANFHLQIRDRQMSLARYLNSPKEGGVGRSQLSNRPSIIFTGLNDFHIANVFLLKRQTILIPAIISVSGALQNSGGIPKTLTSAGQ